MEMEPGASRAQLDPAEPSIGRCALCGVQTEPHWAYCDGCGALLKTDSASEGFGHREAVLATYGLKVAPQAAIESVPAAHAAGGKTARANPNPPRGSLGRWAGAALVVGLIATAVTVHVQTRNELSDVRSTLASTKQQLATTGFDLETTSSQLEKSRAELASTKDILEVTENRLDRKAQHLSGVRGSLDDAQERLDLQSNQIETLKSCLNGVSRALDYAASLQYGPALAALEAVEVSCDDAYQML